MPDVSVLVGVLISSVMSGDWKFIVAGGLSKYFFDCVDVDFSIFRRSHDGVDEHLLMTRFPTRGVCG